jgi:hypothetical protein
MARGERHKNDHNKEDACGCSPQQHGNYNKYCQATPKPSAHKFACKTIKFGEIYYKPLPADYLWWIGTKDLIKRQISIANGRIFNISFAKSASVYLFDLYVVVLIRKGMNSKTN